MYFDKRAKNWDNDPKKTERAKIVATEINNFIKPNRKLNALEFGCGTGLLSFQLKDAFKTITLVDTSEGMIKVLKEKIANESITNFKTFQLDLLEENQLKTKFDVVYTLMTLHHIIDTTKIINIFNSLLNNDGYLCIADLVEEDGSFHAENPNFDGHNGFNRTELNAILTANGFKVEYDKICLEIEKKVDNKLKKYPSFLMICKKNNDD